MENAKFVISDISKYMPLFTETEGNKKIVCLKKGKKKEQQSHRKPGLALTERRTQMPDACLKIVSPLLSALKNTVSLFSVP